MSPPRRKLKILWAVDAFDDVSGVKDAEVSVLHALGLRSEIEVDPVYVLSPTELGISLDFSAFWTDTYAPSAKEALTQKLAGLAVPGLREPQVLIQNRASLKGTVEVLAKFASAKSYDLVVAGSHGRNGFERLMLGSFAEELLLQSEVPVLVVGRHAEDRSGPGAQILLPNDLADPGQPVFAKAFEIAEILDTKVTILSSIPRPLEQVFKSGVYLLAGGWIPVPIYLEKERSEKEEVGERIVIQAKEREIPCDLIVDDTSMSVTESILKHAREKRVRMIVMAAESGPLASALLGSITRQVVRSAPCPVLVVRFKKAHQ